MKKTIITFLLLLSAMTPAFAFAQDLPETPEEAQELLEMGIEEGKKSIPGMVKDMWDNNVLPVWTKMYNWFMDHIGSDIVAWFKEKIGPEIEERAPYIEEEFNKEKEEATEEIPRLGKSLWDRLKEILNK